MKPDPPRRKRRSTAKDRISADQREELIVELRHLRSLAEEITKAYLIHLTSIIQHLVDRFENPDEYDEDPSKVSISKYKQIISAIRLLDVKPQKGRRKDLKRIEDLAVTIEDILED